MKAIMILTGVFSTLSNTLVHADKIKDLDENQIVTANAVLQFPAIGRALLKCPDEIAKMNKSKATVVRGTVTTSRFGLQYSFDFKAGHSKSASLIVRISYISQVDGEQIDPPKVECSLVDTSE